MIVDTSALAAIMLQEPDAFQYPERISRAETCSMSAATFVELSMVLVGQVGPQALRPCDEFIRDVGIWIEPLTVEHGRLAREAFLNFGKGRHPAGLNFGDCFSYALAKSKNEPLLFKGRDFSRTDIQSAL